MSRKQLFLSCKMVYLSKIMDYKEPDDFQELYQDENPKKTNQLIMRIGDQNIDISLYYNQLINAISSQNTDDTVKTLEILTDIFSNNPPVDALSYLLMKIPETLINCLSVNVPQEVVLNVMKFINVIIKTNKKDFIDRLFEENLPDHLMELREHLQGEMLDIYLNIVYSIAHITRRNIDFIADMVPNDFFMAHINDSPEIQRSLCSILFAFKNVSNFKTMIDQLIDIIAGLAPVVDEECAYMLISTLNSMGLKFVSESYVATLIEKELINFGLQFLEHEDLKKVEISANFLSVICINGYQTDSDDMKRIDNLLISEDLNRRKIALDTLHEIVQTKDVYANRFAANQELIHHIIILLSESDFEFKYSAACFLCGLIYNCGQEFLALISDIEWLPQMLSLFDSGQNLDFNEQFAESILVGFQRITDPGLLNHYMEEFMENGGDEMFAEMEFENGELPNYTNSFLAKFVDKDESSTE